MAAAIDAGAQARLFTDARTPQGFVDHPFTRADAEAIYDLARWGPTSNNMSPMRIVWLLDPDGRERLARHAVPKNAEKIRAAPAALVLGMETDFRASLKTLAPHVDADAMYGDAGARRTNALRNSAMQAGYLTMAARALGFDIGWMSGFDASAVDADFFAGTTVAANMIGTVGRGDPASVRPRAARLPFEAANLFP